MAVPEEEEEEPAEETEVKREALKPDKGKNRKVHKQNASQDGDVKDKTQFHTESRVYRAPKPPSKFSFAGSSPTPKEKARSQPQPNSASLLQLASQEDLQQQQLRKVQSEPVRNAPLAGQAKSKQKSKSKQRRTERRAAQRLEQQKQSGLSFIE